MKAKVPAGISDGMTIRLTGQGDAGRQSGSAGDLHLHVRVSPSKEFIRKGDDVYTHREIHFLQALLPGRVQ